MNESRCETFESTRNRDTIEPARIAVSHPARLPTHLPRMHDLPAALIATIVGVYWASVLVKLVRVRRRQHSDAALNPRLKTERRIWPVWIAVVAGWHIFPIIAANFPETWCSLPAWSTAGWYQAVRVAASGFAVWCLGATFYCWACMGTSWSIAVIPGEMKTLVTTGPFAVVRHPIYSLSIQLMLCSLAAVPTLPMLTIALFHTALMLLKVQIEEHALAREFGDRWVSYVSQTGRLVPRLVAVREKERHSPPAPRMLTAEPSRRPAVHR